MIAMFGRRFREGNPNVSGRELALVKAFRDGQIKRHWGLFIDDHDIHRVGGVEADKAAQALRAECPKGVLALEPLLDDPDPGVRSGAAGFLIEAMPEKALRVIHAIANSPELEAGATARLELYLYDLEQKKASSQG
jgi:hypothetical protein